MNIGKINQTTFFKGLYTTDDIVTKENGKQYHNKIVRKMYNIVYHPFENETPEFIQSQIDKWTKGRSFTIWEIDHGHVEGNYYYINNVSKGSTIKEKDADKLMKQGYTKTPRGILSEDNFYKTFNNEAYATMDVSNLNKNRVLEIINKYFL